MTEWEPATEAEADMRDALRATDQERYFQILARTELLLPVSVQALTGHAPVGWGTWTTGGRTHVLAFTSPAALEACLAENAGASRRAAYHDLASAWPNHEWWLAVNPGLPIEGYLPAWFVAQLARGDVRLPGRKPSGRSRQEQLEMAARSWGTAAVPGQGGTPDGATTDLSPERPASHPATATTGVSGALTSPTAEHVAAGRMTTPADVARDGEWAAGARGRVSGENGGSDRPGGAGYGRPGHGQVISGQIVPGPGTAGRRAGPPAAADPSAVSEPPANPEPPLRPAPSRVTDPMGATQRLGPGGQVITAGRVGPERSTGPERPAVVAPRSPAAPQPAAPQLAVPEPAVPEPAVPEPAVPERSAGSSQPADAVGRGAESPHSSLSARYAAAIGSPPAALASVPRAVSPAPPRAMEAVPVIPAGPPFVPGYPAAGSGLAAPSERVLPRRPVPVTPGPDGVASDPGDVTPRSGGVTPGSGDVTPRSGGVTPRSGDVTPGSGGVVSGSGDQGGPAAPAGPPRPGIRDEPTRTERPADPGAAGRPQVPTPSPAVFEPANDVERSLLEAAGDGRTETFLSTLLLAKVLLPVDPLSAPGTRPGDEGFRWGTERIDGVPHIVVFTSAERLAEHRPGSAIETVDVKFVQLIRGWPKNDWFFAVNPGTPVGAKLPGAQIVALASWADEVGLGSEPELTEPVPAAAAAEPVPRSSYAPDREDPGQPTMMQKAIAPSQVSYYLDRGYDRVSGFVHRASEISHLNTPARLDAALGLDHPGSRFSRDAEYVFVVRWPAHRPSLYRIPYGGQNETAMRAMEGWVIERPPFRGNGFAPGEGSDVIAEFKVDSVRLPHGAQLCRIGADGTETLIAVLDSDAPIWRRVGGPDA